MLVCAVTLMLLAAAVSGGAGSIQSDLSGPDLTRLYNSPVFRAEWMIRPLQSPNAAVRALSHTGVRVTLADGTLWLIHKGKNFGIDSQTIVTRADNMSSKWNNLKLFRTEITKEFNGRKNVADFVKTGGETYNYLFNCHVASGLMMLQ